VSALRRVDLFCTAPYGFTMARNKTTTVRKGAEEARNQLPELLSAAEKGCATIITRHGRPIAALVPISEYASAYGQQPLLPEEGTGRGLWGKNPVPSGGCAPNGAGRIRIFTRTVAASDRFGADHLLSRRASETRATVQAYVRSA